MSVKTVGANPAAATRNANGPEANPSILNVPVASLLPVAAFGASGRGPLGLASRRGMGIANTVAAAIGFPSGPVTLPVIATRGAGLAASVGFGSAA